MNALLLLALALLFAACAVSDDATGPVPDLQTFDGTVVYEDLEGGFYGIETATGERLLPTNLPAAFEEDGLAVRVSGRSLDDVATIQMWGRPFEVTEIVRLP